MNLQELAGLLERAGCPAHKSLVMAGQLEKRARQLATRPGQSYEAALAHLLALMQQGRALPSSSQGDAEGVIRDRSMPVPPSSARSASDKTSS